MATRSHGVDESHDQRLPRPAFPGEENYRGLARRTILLKTPDLGLQRTRLHQFLAGRPDARRCKSRNQSPADAPTRDRHPGTWQPPRRNRQGLVLTEMITD